MTHSRKIIFELSIALLVGGVVAFFLLDMQWVHTMLPVAIPDNVARLSIFAFFVLFIFDLMIMVMES